MSPRIENLYNPQAEAALIGIIIAEPNAMAWLGFVKEEHFANPAYRRVLDIAKYLPDEPLPASAYMEDPLAPTLVQMRCKQTSILAFMEEVEVNRLANNRPSFSAITSYARQVVKYGELRKAVMDMQTAIDLAYEGEGIERVAPFVKSAAAELGLA